MINKQYLSPHGLFSIILIMFSLNGCWTTIHHSHPLLQKNIHIEHAKVYFIRANNERYMGIADNRLTILLDQQPLIELVKGEHVLTHLHPGQAWVTIINQTSFGPAHQVKNNTHSSSYDFSAGQTYYIEITPVDGEFRGIHFSSHSISLNEAKKIEPRLVSIIP